jgi:nicotinamidase-related amidase
MNIWEELLSEHDKKVLANWERKPHRLSGLGENPALVVIDIQQCVVGEDRPVYEQQDKYPWACGNFAWAAIRKLQKLIPAAREASIPIIHTCSLTRPEVHLPRSHKSSPWSILNPLSHFQPEVAPKPEDIVIEKQGPSFFFGTPAHQILHHLKVDTLILAGTSTSGCVRAGAIDGIQYNYRVNIIVDCVFDRIELSHKANLFDLWFKYCDLMTMDEAIAFFEKFNKQHRGER